MESNMVLNLLKRDCGNGETVFHQIARDNNRSFFIEITTWAYQNNMEAFLKDLINKQEKTNGNTPLHIAVINEWHELIEDFIKAGADKSIKNKDGLEVDKISTKQMSIKPESTKQSSIKPQSIKVESVKQTSIKPEEESYLSQITKPITQIISNIASNLTGENVNKTFSPTVVAQEQEIVSPVSQALNEAIKKSSKRPTDIREFVESLDEKEPMTEELLAEIVPITESSKKTSVAISKTMSAPLSEGEKILLEEFPITEDKSVKSKSSPLEILTNPSGKEELEFIDIESATPKTQSKLASNVVSKPISNVVSKPQSKMVSTETEKKISKIFDEPLEVEIMESEPTPLSEENTEKAISRQLSKDAKKSQLVDEKKSKLSNIIKSLNKSVEAVQEGGKHKWGGKKSNNDEYISGKRYVQEEEAYGGYTVGLERIVDDEANKIHQQAEEKIRKWLEENKKSTELPMIKAFKSLLYKDIKVMDKSNLEKAIELDKRAVNDFLKKIDEKEAKKIAKDIEERGTMSAEKRDGKEDKKDKKRKEG